jgi:hypothetical protein
MRNFKILATLMKLYKNAIIYKWTVDNLIATIKLIKLIDCKVEDINVDDDS